MAFSLNSLGNIAPLIGVVFIIAAIMIARRLMAGTPDTHGIKDVGKTAPDREKDAEKKWWYISFRELNQKKLLDVYLRHKQKIAKKNEETIVAEREFEFQTKDGALKFRYEEALANDFVSPENGRPLVQINNLNFIQQLETDIQTLNTQITDIKLLQEKYREEMTKVIVAEEVPEEPKKNPKKKIAAKAAKK